MWRRYHGSLGKRGNVLSKNGQVAPIPAESPEDRTDEETSEDEDEDSIGGPDVFPWSGAGWTSLRSIERFLNCHSSRPLHDPDGAIRAPYYCSVGWCRIWLALANPEVSSLAKMGMRLRFAERAEVCWQGLYFPSGVSIQPSFLENSTRQGETNQ